VGDSNIHRRCVEKRGGGAVGFYNRFWLSQGSAYTEVGGQVRTSMIRRAAMGFLVIPSDGDIVYGDIAMRSAVRLIPLVGDGDEEADGWGVV